MPFLSRRSVDPLTSISPPPRDTGYPQKQPGPSQKPRIRARSEGSLFRRVSTLFTSRRRTSFKSSLSQQQSNTKAISTAGIEYVCTHSWNALPRVSSSSTSTSQSSLEIRRPSGLGRRASLMESVVGSCAGSSVSFGTVMLSDGGVTAPTREIPNPFCGAAPSRSLDRSRPRHYPTPFSLPDPVFRAVLEFVPRGDLPAVARASRVFCAAARYALYRALDMKYMRASAWESLYRVLASNKDLAALVISFYCHAWPFVALDVGYHPTDLSADVRQAFQNMCNLKSLTLPSFVSILSHTPSFTFTLTHLTILDEQLTQSQLVALRSWLATQPLLESLSFPHLAQYTSPDGAFVDEWADQHGRGTPFTAILPGLKSLRASAEIVTALCFAMKNPIQHLTLNVHATLYTGLRPGAVIRSLRGVRDMHIIFAPEVDKRTVEKFLSVTGSMLTGENKPGAIKSLEVEVSWADNDGAETLYGIVTSIISRFRGLETLKLTSPFRSIQAPVPVPAAASVPPSSPALSPVRRTPAPTGGEVVKKEFVTCGIEQRYARTWTKRCPSLSDIQFDFTCSMADADVELCGVWFRRRGSS